MVMNGQNGRSPAAAGMPDAKGQFVKLGHVSQCIRVPYFGAAAFRATPSRLLPRAARSDDGRTELGPAVVDAARASRSQEDMVCVGTGSEVECIVPQGSPPGAEAPSTSGRSEAATSASLLDTLLLISPFFFWGTSMVAMKELGPHTTTLSLAAWRLLPAGAALLLWAKASGRPIMPTSAVGWGVVALFGLIDGAFFQGFLAEGLQRTSAGLGSVIIDSQPLSVALLASVLFGERLGARGFAGLALGISGLLLLEVPPAALETLPQTLAGIAAGSSDLASTGSATGWSIWDSGEWWMLLAAQSMAVGTVMVRWVARYCDPVAATGWHMILGGIPLLALTLAQESAELRDHVSQLTAGDAGLLLYVSLLGSAASYGVFFYEATVRGNLTALSSLTFLTPMFAAAGGFLVLGESLTPVQLAGAVVTLGGVTLMNAKGGDGEGKEKAS